MASYPRPTAHEPDPLDIESIPSLSFKDAPIGTTYHGIIVQRAKLLQDRDYQTGKPDFWDDGQPKMAAVMHIEMNGETRSLWAKKPSSLFSALVNAQKAAGAGMMEEGGLLSITFVGTEPSNNPKNNPRKLYTAHYSPPRQVDPMQDDTPAPPVQGARPAPSAQPARPPGVSPAVPGHPVARPGVDALARTRPAPKF